MGRLFWLAHETTTNINHLSLIIVLLLGILSLPLGPHAVQKYLVALTNVAMAYLERRGDKIRFSDHHTIHRAPVCCVV